MIINPWRALRAAREQLAQAEEAANIRNQRIALAEDAYRESHAHVVRQKAEIDDLKYYIESQNVTIARQMRIINKGHFRNPETGRIGPVGKVYE